MESVYSVPEYGASLVNALTGLEKTDQSKLSLFSIAKQEQFFVRFWTDGLFSAFTREATAPYFRHLVPILFKNARILLVGDYPLGSDIGLMAIAKCHRGCVIAQGERVGLSGRN